MPYIHQLLDTLSSSFFWQFSGNKNAFIGSVVAAAEAAESPRPEALSWISDKYADKYEELPAAGLLILSEQTLKRYPAKNGNYLITENPRLAFMEMLSKHFKTNRKAGIEASARISEDVRIGENTYIGHHVVIESGCVIGSDCEILHNTVILANTTIGHHTRIGCNCTIGNYGFGYEKDTSQNWDLIEHLGAVEIGNNVHIHNNTCIDRAVLGKTIIEDNVKIDNLVHIAHGVHIKKNSLIIANAMIAGSTVIGENCWIAPSVSIKNQLAIPDNVNTGIGAVILKNPYSHQTLIGNPAISMEQYKAWSALKKTLLQREDDATK